MPLLKVKNK